MDNKEEIKEVLWTVVDVSTDIELALNRMINIPDKYIEPFMRDYMKIYLSQINCILDNIYKQIQRENPEVIDSMFEKIFEEIENLILKEDK